MKHIYAKMSRLIELSRKILCGQYQLSCQDLLGLDYKKGPFIIVTCSSLNIEFWISEGENNTFNIKSYPIHSNVIRNIIFSHRKNLSRDEVIEHIDEMVKSYKNVTTPSSCSS